MERASQSKSNDSSSFSPTAQKPYSIQRQSDSNIPLDESLQTKLQSNFLQRQGTEEPAEEPEATDIQTKLTIGQPGDRYEQEVDAMAAKVMAMPEPSHLPVQRQAEDVEESETPDEVQTNLYWTPLHR